MYFPTQNAWRESNTIVKTTHAYRRIWCAISGVIVALAGMKMIAV